MLKKLKFLLIFSCFIFKQQANLLDSLKKQARPYLAPLGGLAMYYTISKNKPTLADIRKCLPSISDIRQILPDSISFKKLLPNRISIFPTKSGIIIHLDEHKIFYSFITALFLYTQLNNNENKNEKELENSCAYIALFTSATIYLLANLMVNYNIQF